MMKWMLEDCFHEDTDEIHRALRTVGGLIWRDKYISLKHPTPPFYARTEDPACLMTIGSLNTCKHIQRMFRGMCEPGHFCTLKNYECISYYEEFKKYLLNRRHVYMPVGSLLSQKDNISKIASYCSCCEATSAFIRPNSGDKRFDGQVVDLNNLEIFQKSLIDSNVDSSELCLISRAQSDYNPIEAEYRVFCSAEHGPITASMYRFNGEISHSCVVSPDVYEYVQEIINSVNYYPDPVFCMDIARTRQDGLRLIEINSFSASGFYACDLVKLFAAVKELTIQSFTKYKKECLD